MSSKKRSSKNHHGNSKTRTEHKVSPSFEQQTSASAGQRSSSANKQQSKSSSSKHHTQSTIAQTTSSTMSQPSNATSASGFSLDVPNQFAYTEADLSEVSAWTHHLHQSQAQIDDNSYPSYDTTQTSTTCQYHASIMESKYQTAWAGSGHGLSPLERWLGEHARESGALALQLGLQLHADCTCNAM